MTTLKHTYAVTQRAAIDLSLSENPLGPSPRAIKAIVEAAEKSHLYPYEEQALITLIAQHHNISENTILLGAGANQLLEDFLKVFALQKNIVVPSATFPESIACMAVLKGSVKTVSLDESLNLNLEALLEACAADTGLIHLCNPNNPTGIWIASDQILTLAKRSPVPLLISEASADFVKETMINRTLPANVIVVRSFSKGHGLAGLRIGYAVASPNVIATMKSNLRSYRVSSLAIAAAIAAMQDQAYLQKSIAYILQEKEWLMREMRALGFKIVPSQAQTFIAQVPKEFDHASHFCAFIKRYNMAVVNCSLYPGLDQYVRISPQTHLINKKFIVILKKSKEENQWAST